MIRIATCLLIVVASAAAPWLLGGFSSWCFLLAPILAFVATLLWLPQVSKSSHSALSYGAIAFGTLLVGFVWFQATPLPRDVLSALTSPERLARLDSLSSEVESCEAVEPSKSTPEQRWSQISSDPPETRRQWVIIATALCICLISMSLANDEFCRLLIIFSLAINGALFAIFAIVQRASAPRDIYWTIRPQWESLPFGAFVNRNHAALFLALSALCALFCICLLLSQKISKRSAFGGEDSSFDDQLPSLTELRMIWLSQKDSVLLPLVFCALFCGVSSIVAASRSGALAFGVVVLISAVMLFLAGADRRLIAVIGVLGGVAAIISSAKLDYLMERFGGSAIEAGFGGRYAHWKDVLDQYPEYAWTGVGFGSYAYATLPYLSKPATAWFQHADNQFVETFVELGLVGSMLMIGFVGLLAARCIRLICTSDTQARIVGLFGLGLIGIGAVNSLSDFALVMAGALLPMALAVGLVLGFQLPTRKRSEAVPRWSLLALAPKLAISAVALWAALIGLANFANREQPTEAENAIRVASRSVSNRIQEPSRVAITNEAQAAMNAYVLSIQNAVNKIDQGLLESDAYSLENLALLRRSLASEEGASKEGESEFQEVRDALNQQTALKAARKKYLRLITMSPMRFDNQLALARLDLLLCPGPSVSHWVHNARQIHPTSGIDASKTGIVSIINGDFDTGGLLLAQALRETQGLERNIYSVLRSQMTVQELRKHVLRDDAALLVRAADQHFSEPGDWAARSYLYSQLRSLIESGTSSSLSAADSSYYLAKAKYMTGDRDAAYVDFEAACRIEPINVQWMRELARLYQKDGKTREALRILKLASQEFGEDEALSRQIENLEKRNTIPRR